MKPRMSYDYTLQKNVRGKPYITVSAKGIANGMSDIPNDGADFGPDTPNTYTSGIKEAIDYQQQNGGEIKLLPGRFIISPNAPLTQVSSSNILGYPEYAVIPISAQYSSSNVSMLNIIGSGGDILTAGSIVGAVNFNTNQMTIIDVSQLTNLPTDASVVLFGYNRLNVPSETIISETINLHDFAILTAIPSSSGQNICGGYDFNNSMDANVTNVTVYSPNYFFSTVFPAKYVIGQAIDAEYGDMCWVDNIASYAMYIGFLLGSHTYAGTVINNSCYYGLIPYGDHGVIINRYDTVGCIYPVYALPNLAGPLQINFMEGEDYSAVSSSGNQEVADIYISSGTPNAPAYIIINDFHMEYANGSPNPRLPVISNNSTGNWPVIIKYIGAQIPAISGTTAGTVQPTVLEYSVNASGLLSSVYKKMMFIFNGYENNTTTNQTIPYPSNGAPHNNQLTFTATPVITANNTGLTITASTTGITITSPNSTTTYSGIVIVEGY
jgi:hypothetical protein